MIRVKNLSMSYGDKEILKDLSFEIQEGQTVGFLGANGAGKSTTMNLLTGYLTPDSGEIFICEQDMIKHPTEAKRCVGYLPEIPPLYKDMRVEEYLIFAADLKGIRDRKNEVLRVLSLLELTDKRHEFIKNLSKGYGQRVGFAQALLGDPKVLILDEPMVGLDPAEAKRTRDLIKSLKDDHCIMISSHILSEIEELCNEILMIKDGSLVLDDSTRSTKRRGSENRYQLIVKGKREDIEKLLNAHTGLSKVSFLRETEEGVVEFVVTANNNRDIRDSLFSYLVGKKYNVYGITRLEASLEDVFMKMNDGEEA